MSTKDEVAKETVEVPPQEQKEDLPDEDEPVDLELQKAMKNVKFDESAFGQGDSKSSAKKEDPSQKKGKKNKGQDFLDYASKNNIPINIEYEQDKYEKRKKGEKKENVGNYKNNKYHGGKGKYQNENNNYGGNKYNNRQGGYKRQAKRPPFKFGGNKFDACNIQKPYEQHYQENVYVPRQLPVLKEDKEIIDFLEEMFSANTLNKDLYLRRHISENGEIDINDVVNYNTIQKNGITAQKLTELMPQTKGLETKEDNGKTLVVIKGFKEMNLNTIETITANKKAQRMQKMQQNMYSGQMGEFYPYMMGNYIHMQNNYFIPTQGFYPYPQQGYQYQQSQPAQPQAAEAK